VTFSFVGIAALAFATQIAGNADQSDSTARLTLDRALALAEQYHPLLRSTAAQTDMARGGVLAAKSRPNPEFNFMSGHQSQLQPSAVSGRLDHYGFAQPIELPSVRKARIEAATLNRQSSEWAEADARLTVRAQVKQLFYEALRRKGEVQLARENLKTVEDLERRIKVQVDVGEAARLELTRADAELATTRALVRTAELGLNTSLATLRGAISGPLEGAFDVEGSLDENTRLPSLEQLRVEVLARHPELRVAEIDVKAAGAALKAEEMLRKPQPTWILEFEKMPDLTFFRTGVAISLPFWNRRQGQIAEASARVRHASALVTVRRLELTTAIETAYGEYETANQLIASYQSGALREAEAALNAAEAAFRFGERGIIEVLDAQRLLRSVRLDYLNAQYNRQEALIEIERLRTTS